MEGYLTISETAVKWGISGRRINALCLEGRIDGATKAGNMWLIPENAVMPDDKRVKTGKYKKVKK